VTVRAPWGTEPRSCELLITAVAFVCLASGQAHSANEASKVSVATNSSRMAGIIAKPEACVRIAPSVLR